MLQSVMLSEVKEVFLTNRGQKCTFNFAALSQKKNNTQQTNIKILPKIHLKINIHNYAMQIKNSYMKQLPLIILERLNLMLRAEIYIVGRV